MHLYVHLWYDLSMSERLLAVMDNGQRVRGECDDCGASLRYEYVTDAGIYGSECVHRHIHQPDWMTLKAKHDAEKWAAIQNSLNALTAELVNIKSIECVEYRDGSISILGIWQHYIYNAVVIFVNGLIDAGWNKSNVESWITPGSHKYTLTRPEGKS